MRNLFYLTLNYLEQNRRFFYRKVLREIRNNGSKHHCLLPLLILTANTFLTMCMVRICALCWGDRDQTVICIRPGKISVFDLGAAYDADM